MHVQRPHGATAKAVVVGACGGIGRATAALLSRSGYDLALLDIRGSELESLRSELGGEATISESCAISDSGQVRVAFDRIGEKWHCVDALVNAAGVFSYATIQQLGEDEWRRTLDVNLTGIFLVSKAAIPLLQRAPTPRIVNVLSIAATSAFASESAYCASKSGALALSRVMAAELRPLGICVSGILPGAVDTPLWNNSEAPFDRQAMLGADDIARAILFILQQPRLVTIDEMTISSSAGTL